MSIVSCATRAFELNGESMMIYYRILSNFIHRTHASHVSIFMCQVKKVCKLSELSGSGQGRAEIPLEEFGRVLRRFSTLAAPDALELIDEVAWQSRVLTSDALRWNAIFKKSSAALIMSFCSKSLFFLHVVNVERPAQFARSSLRFARSWRKSLQ